MPEGDRGFYTNWWNDGKRGDPGWERYDLDELIPLVERKFRIRKARRWHAIAGLSMGGMGAIYLASQRPDYFGSAARSRVRLAPAPGSSWASGWSAGSTTSRSSARGRLLRHRPRPAKLTDNLRQTRLYVTVGDGTPAEGQVNPAGALVEAGAAIGVGGVRRGGAGIWRRPDLLATDGIHDWPEWRRALKNAIEWGFFKRVPEATRRRGT